MADPGTIQVQTPDGSAMSSSSAFGNPFYQYGSSIQNMTNPKSLLDDLEMQLRGRRKLPGGKWMQITAPLMNDLGINRVMSLAYSLVNRVTIMSNLDEKFVNGLMVDLLDTLEMDMMVNGRKYEIKDNVDKASVSTHVKNVTYLCLNRCKNEGERRFWKGSISETRITQDQQAQNKSWLAKLNPFSK